MRTEGFDEGYQKGYDEGHEDGEYDYEQLMKSIENLMDYINSNYDINDDNIVKDIYTRLSKIL